MLSFENVDVEISMISRRSIIFFGFLMVANVAPFQASAAGNHTWIASNGEDNSVDCTSAAPCRRLDNVYSKTVAGGEITGVDLAGYGAVSIEKSITL